MPIDWMVHKHARVAGTNEVRLVSTTPLLRLKGEGAEFPLYVQSGRIYAEGGDEIRNPPEWFWGEARKCSVSCRREHGLVLPEEGKMIPFPQSTPEKIVQPRGDQAPPIEDPDAFVKYYSGEVDEDEEDEDEGLGRGTVVVPHERKVLAEIPVEIRTWKCTEGCDETVPLKLKGVHIAQHRRIAKAAARKKR